MKALTSAPRNQPVLPQAAWLMATLLSACALPALAQEGSLLERAERAQANDSKPPPVRIIQSQGEPLATAGTSSTQDFLSGRESSATSRQTMLWAVHPSGVGVGIGVEQRGPYRYRGGRDSAWRGTELQAEGGVLVGVSLATGERTALTLQTPLLNSRPVVAGPSVDEMLQQQQLQSSRQVRMGLVFNTTKPYSDLRKGLRMELSGQTTVSFKPRAGRVGLTVQKIW